MILIYNVIKKYQVFSNGDAKTAKKIFNPKSFICVNDYDSVEKCVEYIINLYLYKKNY